MFSRLFKVLQLRSRSQVSSSTTPTSRSLRLEPLEVRELLSATDICAPAAALAAEYASTDILEPTPIPLDALDAPVPSAANSPTPLEKPVLTVTGKTGLSITVSWNAVPNAERYSLSYKPSNETTWTNKNVGTNASYTVSGLNTDSDYDFRVKAIGDGVDYKSVYSEVVSAKTNATPDPSETPIPLEKPALIVTGRTGLTVSVSWNAVDNAERYSLSYKPSSETTWKNVNVGTNTSYTITGLENNTGYDVRVKAIGDGVVYKSVYSAIVHAETNESLTPLNAPVPTVDVAGPTFLTINWDDVPNVERYSFSYKPADETTWTNVNVGTNLSHTVRGLDLNTEYDVRVKAIGDGVVYKSVYSSTVRVKTAAELIPLATPVLTVAETGPISLTINWDEVPSAVRYSFSYKPASGTTWTNVNVGTNLSYTVGGLDLDAEYDVRVKAIGDGVDYKNVYSAIVRAKTESEFIKFEAQGANLENRTLELLAPEGYAVYYTTDGSDPVVSPENLYSEPFALTANASRLAASSNLINVGSYKIYDNSELPKAVTVKAVAVAPDGTASAVSTRTFFLQEREPIAVISISTDYDNLLDYDTGIMVKGAYYDAWVNTPEAASIIANKEFWKYQGNYTQKGKDWERSATIEIFDGDNYIVENCGIRLRGDASRMYAQKPFAIYFSEDYGADKLDYALFNDATTVDGDVLSSYKDFILRNGGNDTEYLKFHDALIQSLAQGLNFATQSSRPAVLYLNGEYMGVYVMQERYDASFFADRYLVDEDDVLVAQEGAVVGNEAGDAALYEELLSYANMDLTNPEVYNAFCNAVDVESMIDYYATEIYIANADWSLTKNTCLWRTRTHENDSFGDGKWRWALYDTEFSSSLYGSQRTAYDYDSFADAIDADPLFASVIKNADFYQAFTEKMESLALNNFSKTNVNSALDRFSSVYKPYMSNYYKRFGDSSWAWNGNISGIRNFFANRAEYILNFVENYQP